MLYRQVDTDGDMIPLQRKSQLLSGAGAVAQAIKSKMQLHKGEWFEDPDTGSPVLNLIINERLSENDLGSVAHQIIGYISETIGVKAVQAAKPVYNRFNRSMTLPCTITATSGETIALEVSTAL